MTSNFIHGRAVAAADGRRSYLLACNRSYGRFLLDAITDAGTEFSIGTTSL